MGHLVPSKELAGPYRCAEVVLCLLRVAAATVYALHLATRLLAAAAYRWHLALAMAAAAAL